MSSFLPRDELAEHLRRYVAALGLNVVTSARVVSSVYDEAAQPARPLQGLASFDTQVLIIGGGNCGVAVSARLKALGVESVILERNERIGDNWGKRYDCLRLHTPTGYSQMPFMRE